MGCVSYQRSLELLHIDNKAGAYGEIAASPCDVNWHIFQRDGWCQHLRGAEVEVTRQLKQTLCPTEVYDEIHKVQSTLYLRQTPVAYLGKKTYGDWNEVEVDYSGDVGEIEICDSEIVGFDIETEVEFSYPDAVLECYEGCQELQDPCFVEITDSSCGLGENGWTVRWDRWQLVRPDVDETQTTEAANYLEDVKWRTITIDSDLAIEDVGTCECECCSTDPVTTATLEDATEGIVCLNGCDPYGLCTCRNARVRVNYATGFIEEVSAMAPDLELAVVLLALDRAGKTPVKPCGCDNTFIDRMLEIDPTAGTDFATNLRFGFTVAAMQAWRIVNNVEEQPHYNQPANSGGLFSRNRNKSRHRRQSVLRG